ncbi:MAG: hypothetical protein SFW67_34720 [Myxococcaceae bacterium]|nr:hypothetical protein [Myxococcaceae bacterium]
MGETVLTLTAPEAHVLVTDQVLVPARRSRLKELLLVPASAEARHAARAALKSRGLPDGKKALLATRFGRELACLAAPRGELLIEHARGDTVTRRLFVLGEHDVVEVEVSADALAIGAAQSRAEGLEALVVSLAVTSELKGLEPVLMHPQQLEGVSLLWAGAFDGAPRAVPAAVKALAGANVPAADVEALVTALVQAKVVMRAGDTLELVPSARAVTQAVWSNERLRLFFRETPESDLPQHVVDDAATVLELVGAPGHRLLVTPVDEDDVGDTDAGLSTAEAGQVVGSLVFSRTSARAVVEVLLDAVADADEAVGRTG